MNLKTSISKIQAILVVVSLLASPFIGLAPPTMAATADLFFSEYIEGSNYNKALEIYNGTGAAVDLSTYTLELYSNGSATASQTQSLSGSLADGDVFVAVHKTADAALTAVADLVEDPTSVINFNGDDAIVLKNGGVVIDAIGQTGVDPGSEWGSGLASTQDNTIRRPCLSILAHH